MFTKILQPMILSSSPEEEESQVTQFRASIFTIWNFLI